MAFSSNVSGSRPVQRAMPSPADRRRGVVPLRLRLLGLLLLATIGVGCPCVRGAVNASPGLRWWLFSNFGAQRVCPEMMKRSAPLKLDPNGNTIGRFFPSACRHSVDDQREKVTIHFEGTGYAWTPFAGRIGFSAQAAVEYSFDFRMEEEAVYVYATNPRAVFGPEFRVASVENKVVDWATRTPAGYMVNTFGSQIVLSKLTSGFTVVHTDDGDEFTLGQLRPPARPKKPFDTKGDDRYVFANETTELRNNQVDFLGPFEVADDDQALFLRFRVNGPPVDVLVFHRGTADLWRDALQRGAPLGLPPQPPIRGFPVQPGREQTQKIKLRKGQYVAVIDNSNRVGVVSPPWNPLSVVGGNAAVVSYVAELGEAD